MTDSQFAEGLVGSGLVGAMALLDLHSVIYRSRAESVTHPMVRGASRPTGGSSSVPVYHNLSDPERAYQCVENFMNSPPHSQALLSPNYRDCIIGIIWSGKKYVCVVNFIC